MLYFNTNVGATLSTKNGRAKRNILFTCPRWSIIADQDKDPQ